MKEILVIGAGTMGSGIAQVAAQGGYNVILYDIKREFIDKGLLNIRKNLDKLVDKNIINDSERDNTYKRIRFAEKLENNESVKVYAKLPDWFKIPTPLGSYNPDWAIVIEDNGQNKLYFVVETKGSIEGKDLRPTELAKIQCGEKHFAALDNDAKFVKADSFQKLTEQAV